MKLIILIAFILLNCGTYAKEDSGLNIPRKRELNLIEKEFVETKNFELFYKWNELSSEMKGLIKSFTGDTYAVSYGMDYKNTDIILEDLESSQIRYYGVSKKLEFIYIKTKYGNNIILFAKGSNLSPKACIYDTPIAYIDTVSGLQYLMEYEWDKYDNYSEGVELLKCMDKAANNILHPSAKSGAG